MRPTAACRRGSRRLSGGAARTPAGPGPLPTPPESPQPGAGFLEISGFVVCHTTYASGLPLRGFSMPGCRPAAFVRPTSPHSMGRLGVPQSSFGRRQTGANPARTSCHIRKRGRILRCNLLVFEPKPRFELGTPSLRVKCSTAELFRPGKTSCLLSDCKYLKKILFLQQFCKKSLISSYLRI